MKYIIEVLEDKKDYVKKYEPWGDDERLTERQKIEAFQELEDYNGLIVFKSNEGNKYYLCNIEEKIVDTVEQSNILGVQKI